MIGIRLVPLLINEGHLVAGMTRSPDKLRILTDIGADAILCDIYDSDKLLKSVVGFRPEIIIDQLTDLPDNSRDMPSFVSANNRMRVDGTKNLLFAAKAAGSPHFVVQSIAWKVQGAGGAAAEEMEKMVLEYGGTVLRYGQLYGPGTYYETSRPPDPRIHVENAARLTLEHMLSTSQVIDIVENAPSP